MMLHAHLLRVPLEPQPLLVCAGDPFVPSVDPKWLPQRSVRMLSASVASLLEGRAQEDRRIKDEERERARKEKTWESNKKKSRNVETDEQKRQCQEWLTEWSGVS